MELPKSNTLKRIKKYFILLYKVYLKGGYFGLNDMDRRLEKYMDYNDGFFVELGANDGMTQSNSYHFELKRSWKGVLVEPSPHNYIDCLALRGSKSKVFCNACVSFDFKEKFVEIVYSDLMSIARGLENDIVDIDQHARNGITFLSKNESLFTFGAVARPLQDILITAGAPKVIDFLSLDVEGAEIEVLKGIDFTDFTFKYMLIECRDFKKLSEFLNDKGYKFVTKLGVHDYLFSSIIH